MPRAKSAKGKADAVEAEEAREVLLQLDAGAPPPLETLNKVFHLHQPCSASCGAKGSKGSKDNPCCFHGLLPAENSFRKKGLWQKEPVLGQLGHDPADDRRKAPGMPAGLRNLGNTCYVNAAMQFLHSLPAFRNALYQLEPQLAEQEIVRQMRDLFIEMHFGPKRYVDPEPFANALLLDHAIQQDGQEFLKLLLSKLEAVFGASQREDVATVVQGLFQGHLSHVTTCHTCKRPSEGSKRQVEFYELSLQVQHMPSLQDSLVAALAPDVLQGDNQYFCDYCAAKSDADRRMRLRSLPPYLCLALQRFAYDHETWQKKKVLHKLSIPLQLNMGSMLLAAGLPLPEAAPLGPDKQPVLPGSPNSTYELVAVLIHKGTSASHGHYVAHIKLHDTGTWWRFDDDEAVDMGPQPTSHPGDHGTTAAAAAAAAGTAAAAAGGAAEEDVGANAKPAVGKKRGRGGAAGAGRGPKRAKGGSSKGGGGGRKGKKASSKEPWESDSEADAEAEAATAAAEAANEQDSELQRALQMSMMDAQCNGDAGDMSAADWQAAMAAAADMDAAEQQGSRRKATNSAGSSRGKGRGKAAAKGRGRGKAAAAAAEAEAGAADAAAAAGAQEAAEAPAGPDEDSKGLPRALVDQIVSANAYFLVYRQVPLSAQQAGAGAGQAAGNTDGSAAPTAAAAAAAAAMKREQGQQQQQQPPLRAVDTNVEPSVQQAKQQQAEPAAAAAAVKPEQAVVQAAGEAGQQQQQGLHGPDQQQQQQLLQAMQQQLQALPQAVQDQVAKLHKDFEEACALFQQRKQDALTGVNHRKEEVSSITELLPVPEGATDGCFICLSWLDSWVNGESEPGPLDNSVLLCKHHKLNPLLPAGTMKYISDIAWQQLTARHKGGPHLAPADVCQECLRGMLRGLVSSEDLGLLRDQLLAALEADEAQQEELLALPSSYYVSKTWVLGFRRRGSSGGSGRLEPPTAGITCRHSQLAPEGSSGTARRFAVSPATWSLLCRLWPQQVLLEVQAKQNKKARAAAKRAAAGDFDAAAVADAAVADVGKDAGNEGDCVVLDSPKKEQQQQPQQQQGGEEPDVQVISDVDVTMSDAEQEQQQQQQPGGTGSRGASEGPDAAAAEAAAGAVAAASWQLPFPLDGSVQLTESQLLQALPVFQVANAYDCEECSACLQQAAAGHKEVKQQLEGQKQVLGKLLAVGVTEALEPGSMYYLVPNNWVDTWRKHLQAALSKKLLLPSQLPPAPEPLPQAIRALMCRCHPQQPLLAVPLPDVAFKRGRFSQADPNDAALRVITEQEWQQLLLHYSGLDYEDGSNAAAAAASPPKQRKAAASGGSAGSGRSQRRGGRASRGRHDDEDWVPEHEQQQEQEQHDILLQRIASLADTDPGFRGIRAWLQAAPVEEEQQQQQQQQPQQQQQQQPANGVQSISDPQTHTAAAAGDPSALEGGGADSMQQQQQPGALEAAQNGGQQVGSQQPDQQQSGQGLDEASLQVQDKGATLANGVQQQQQQQQQQSPQEQGGTGSEQQQQPKQQRQQRQRKQQQGGQQAEHAAGEACANGAPAAAAAAAELSELTGNGPQATATRRSKRQRLAPDVVDLSGSLTARQAAPDDDVVVVESVNLADEQPAAAAAAGAADGAADDVVIQQVVDAPTSLRQAAQPQDSQPSRGRQRRAAAERAISGRSRSRAATDASAPGSAAAAMGLEGSEFDSGLEEAAAVATAPIAMRGWFVTDPAPCEATLAAEAAARRAATLVYDAAELMVELTTEEELAAALATAAGAGERRSRRARKNRQPIKACSTDTLAMLRLKVFEVLSVHPQNQRLYVRGQLLQGEQDTLAKLEIFPDEEIRLVNANQVPDDDYASVFDGVAGSKRKAREVETGFKDTALHGSSIPAAAAQQAAGDAAGADAHDAAP